MMIKKILVLRLSSLGDVVLVTPVLRLLFKQLAATVDFCTKAQFKEVVIGNPYINRIYTYEYINRDILRNENYDLIVDLQNNLRTQRLVYRLPCLIIKRNKQSWSKWLYLKFGINYLSPHHVSEQNIMMLESLGVKDDGQGLDIYPHRKLPQIPSTTTKTIVIVAGGTYVTKRIPIALINDIILRNSHYQYILLGGSDIDQSLVVSGTNVHNFIAKNTWQESIAMVEAADIVITGDTGLMHVSAALQKPMIVIWGSTSRDFGFYPYYGSKNENRHLSVEVEHLNCRPCSKYGRSLCPKGHMNCLALVTTADVESKISMLLSSERAEEKLDDG